MRNDVLKLSIIFLVLIVCGTVVLSQPVCTPRDERDAQYFLARRIAESAFDATSAVCGCGLLAGPLESRYSPVGRWTLWGFGVAGALAYAGIFGRSLQKIWPDAIQARVPTDPPSTPPPFQASAPLASTIQILVASILTCSVLSLLVFFAGRIACPTVGIAESAWLVGSTFFSLGLVSSPVDSGTALMTAFIALIAGLGWPMWLAGSARARRDERLRSLRRSLFPFLAACVSIVTLLCAIESPRGGESIGKLTEREATEQVRISQESLGSRFMRCAVLTLNASNGQSVESLTDRAVRDSSRLLLGCTMLLGGMAGSFAGGATVTLLWLGWRKGNSIWRRAAVRIFIGLGCLTIIVAFGLILIETAIATRYQLPPTFADAFLDAASAVGGGNLSSGLTHTVTARNLVSGIGLGISFDFVGMGWLMLAMWAGRILPIGVLASLHSSPK